VVFTPAKHLALHVHRQERRYGFSGDSLALGICFFPDFSTLLQVARRRAPWMEKYGTKFLYPGTFGKNVRPKRESMIGDHNKDVCPQG